MDGASATPNPIAKHSVYSKKRPDNPFVLERSSVMALSQQSSPMIKHLFKQANPIQHWGLVVGASLILGAAGYAGPALALTPKLPPVVAASQVSLTQGVRKTVLSNGLTVLTKEVKSAPVVTVQVWYKIGSYDEAPGVNGIAHQLEHLMFKGTKARPIQFGRLFSALGSQSNAFTSYDQTAYYGTVERDKLTAMLEIEADRMANATIDENALKSEKRVVISELQGYENNPGYRLGRAVQGAAFPTSTYGLTVGGTKSDIERFNLEQVRYYYNNYYSPKNATLIVVGDFETDQVLKNIRQIFEPIPNRQPGPLPKIEAPARPAIPSPIVLKEPGSAALTQSVYPLPNSQHPDVPALHVMDLILTQGRGSRLYQSIVESGLASGFSAYPANMASGGWYEFTATAAPGKETQAIDAAFLTTLKLLQDQPVTAAELQRAKVQLRSGQILRNRDITAQARQLGDDQTSNGGYEYRDRYLAAIEKVTAADIQRVTKRYFSESVRKVGFFEPTTATAPTAPVAAGGATTGSYNNVGKPVDPAEVAQYLPKLTPSSNNVTLPERIILPNGLKLLLLPDKSTPTVTLSGFIRAGSDFDTTQKAGLSQLTAANLMNGTQGQTGLAIAQKLDDRGLELGFSSNREGVRIGGQGLSSDLPILLDTLSDVLQQATFPTKDLELSRARSLTALKGQLDNPNALARRIFQQTVYPSNHPYHTFPTEQSLQAIAQPDLQQFYRRLYRPDNTVLALVGDFNAAEVKQMIEQRLGQWKPTGTKPQMVFPTVGLPEVSRTVPAVLPGKSQSVSFLGYVGITRQDPRFYSALVLNQILGGDTLSSRLGTEIRDRQGLTYGIYSYFQSGNQAGPFFISMQTAPEDAKKAIASTVKLLEQIRDQGVSAAEVSNAVRSLTSTYPVNLADPGDMASTILYNEVYGLNPTELRQYTAQISAVTQAQVNQAAKELLQPDRLVVVTAGPEVKAAR
jgi:zinc protease